MADETICWIHYLKTERREYHLLTDLILGWLPSPPPHAFKDFCGIWWCKSALDAEITVLLSTHLSAINESFPKRKRGKGELFKKVQ